MLPNGSSICKIEHSAVMQNHDVNSFTESRVFHSKHGSYIATFLLFHSLLTLKYPLHESCVFCNVFCV
jgi:hypothetical protein